MTAQRIVEALVGGDDPKDFIIANNPDWEKNWEKDPLHLDDWRGNY
jgi:hypothetical protein